MAAPCAARSFFGALSSRSTMPLRTVAGAGSSLLLISPELSLRHLSPFPPRSSARRRGLAACSAALSSPRPEAVEAAASDGTAPRWKPMCLYFAQGKCTMMSDSAHLKKFNHDFSVDLRVVTNKSHHLHSQDLDYLLVLDLEGKVEILEFPVVVIDARTTEFVDAFHRCSSKNAMQ